MSSSSAPSTYTTHAKHSNSSYKKERRKEKRKKKERTHVINPGPITRTVRESNYSNLLEQVKFEYFLYSNFRKFSKNCEKLDKVRLFGYVRVTLMKFY